MEKRKDIIKYNIGLTPLCLCVCVCVCVCVVQLVVELHTHISCCFGCYLVTKTDRPCLI